MSNNTDSQKAEIKDDAEKSTSRSSCSCSKFLSLVLLLLFLFVILGLSYGWYQGQKFYQDYQLKLKELSLQNQTLLQQIQDQSEKLMQVQQNNRVLMQKISSKKNNWVLEEVAYFIRLANINLSVQKNVKSAIVLLQSADEQLQQADDPSFIKLRQAIADDMTQLKTVPTMDLSGLCLRLQTLSQQVDQLPLSNEKNAETKTEKPKEISSSMSAWKKGLEKSLAFLKQAVIIHHQNEPIQPLMDDHQRALLNLNFQALFIQAQWAVLNNQPVVFTQTLSHIQELLQTYFVHKNPSVLAIEQSLKDLSTTSFNQSLPTMSDTLQQLAELRK